MHSVYLLRDNQTVAGEQDIVRDHDLIKRTHSKGILMPDTWWDGQGMCAMYFYAGEVNGDRGGTADTTMNMVLRPGEAIVWRWGQPDPPKYHGALWTMPTYQHVICNGLWEYRPDFSRVIWRGGLKPWSTSALAPTAWPPRQGKRGTIIWTIRSPYVLVGGRIEAEGEDARFFVCVDGKTWQAVQEELRRCFSTVGPARYEYKLKCELEGSARLRRLAIINDVQMAPLTLPEMCVGENTFSYSDQSSGDRGCAYAPLGGTVGLETADRRRRPLSIRPTAAKPMAPILFSSGRLPRTLTATPSKTITSSCRTAPTQGSRCRCASTNLSLAPPM